jgi:hypothetical protein
MYARGKLDQPAVGTVSGGADETPRQERSRRITIIWGSIFHESLDTLILGTLSTSLGTVLILVPLLRGSRVQIDLALSTYLALIPVGTSLGVIGIIRARMAGRFTSSLSTLGALLCCAPAAPQILRSLGIYMLIMAPFAFVFYGTAMIENLVRWMTEEDPDDDDPNASH